MQIKRQLARLKRQLFKKPFIKDRRYPAYWFDQILASQKAYLVQIGSNDGKTGDPLYPLLQKHAHWRALFVEPVPYSFEMLQSNYPDARRFRFENVAINEGEALNFYWVDPAAKEHLPDLPYWYDQLGSFDKQHIVKHFDGALEPFIRSSLLEGITLPQLLDRNEVKEIDILHIDTEGYDWKILSQLDLERFRPKFILYEHNHLSDADRQDSIDFLKERYQLFTLGIDLLAVDRNLGQELLTAMSKHMQKTAGA